MQVWYIAILQATKESFWTYKFIIELRVVLSANVSLL